MGFVKSLLVIVIGLLPAIALVLNHRRGGRLPFPAVVGMIAAVVLGCLLVLLADGVGLPADWLTYVIVAVLAAVVMWPTLGGAAKAEVTDAAN